jgi:putative chitinase
MMITLHQFRSMIPTNREPEVWFNIAVDMFPKYNINTPNRIAGFMAQCGHESNDFQVLEENLNYSESRLLEIFSRYFGAPPKRNPRDYARNPRKLANYVYMDEFRSASNRLGNIHRDDGWKFRGGGIKQITGRDNFEKFGRSVGMTADQAADYVRTKKGAFESACWFWKTKNLNAFADNDDIDGMSRRVNGGNIGLQDRRNRYNSNKQTMRSRSSRPVETVSTQSTPVANNKPVSENSVRSFFSRFWPFS